MSFYWSLLKPEALVIALYIEAVGMEACYSVVHGSVKSSSNTCILCLMLLISCMHSVSGMCLSRHVYENAFCFAKSTKENDVFFYFSIFYFLLGDNIKFT